MSGREPRPPKKSPLHIAGPIRIWTPSAERTLAERKARAGDGGTPRAPRPVSTLPPRQWPLIGAAGEPVLVTSHGDRSVRCRVGTRPDVALVRESRPGMIRCAAAGEQDGRTVIATSEHDGVLCTWDAATGRPAGPPLFGHADWVGALAWFAFDGLSLLASGGDDQTLCFWKPFTGVLLRRIRLGQTTRRLRVLDGELLVTLAVGEVVIRPLTGLLTDVPRGPVQHAEC